MTDEELTLAIAELREVVRCRCDEAYRDRGLKDPHCECDSAEAVKVVANRIKALTEQLSAARQDAKAAEDELEMQEQEACMMENDYIKLEKERDALEVKLARAEWLLTDAAVQLEEGKIKTRRNRAGLIWQFLEEIKGESNEALP
jgi:chromosome segregation ATPase